MHHPKADVDRIYIPRHLGGRGLLEIESNYKTAIIGMHEYLKESQEPLMQSVFKHERQKKLYSIAKNAEKFRQEFQIEVDLQNIEGENDPIKKLKLEAKKAALKNHLDNWKNKPLHGQFPTRVDKADIDKELTYKWLKSSELKGETEGFIMAAQDQSLPTKAQQCRIYGITDDPKCRLCGMFDETVDHLISGCPMLANTEYTQRHNKVGQYIHWKICQHFQLPTTGKWYEHHPSTVCENEKVSVLWDMPITTDREIKANRPDIVIKDHNNKTCLLIDMTIPSDRNVGLKEFEKLSKYKDLELEIQRMWAMSTCVIPVVIGALGTIRTGMNKQVSKIPGEINIDQIQKIVLLGTAHILRKSLDLSKGKPTS
jgi:hypothetical protein